MFLKLDHVYANFYFHRLTVLIQRGEISLVDTKLKKEAPTITKKSKARIRALSPKAKRDEKLEVNLSLLPCVLKLSGF